MTADDSYQPTFPDRPGTAESAQLPEVEPGVSGDIPAGRQQRLPEELPPVEPPSAGFIVQLFLVPGLIVAAIIGVWVLFGRIAEGRQDWRELVAELPSGNEQRRWRAALGLAQMLKADEASADGTDKLSRNPEVASSLSRLFDEQLQSRTQQEDDLKQQAFLARTLGFLDVPETVLPALQRALDEQHDREVRQNALESIAVIAGRAAERDGKQTESAVESLTDPGPEVAHLLQTDNLVDDVITASRDQDPLIGQLGAYTLGLLPAADSVQRLKVILSNEGGGRRMQLNAAVGLARMGRPDGLPVFLDVLRESASTQGVVVAAEPKQPGETDEQYTTRTEMTRRNEQIITLRNTLRAIEVLRPQLKPAEREELVQVLKPVAETSEESQLRIDAQKLLLELKEDGEQ